jgi:hypothetical protein
VSPEVQARLLASIHADRLVILCGAGLSMAKPSGLPSAKDIANACFDAYKLTSDPACNPGLRDDLEKLAEHFAGLQTLASVFIQSLVPWRMFVRTPNSGHAAIADFLVTRAACAALSSNYDTLIERRAKEYGADFQTALDGDEATVTAAKQGPLLKFHGCADRSRPHTVWALSQLSDAAVAQRIASSRAWMGANLRQKDLLVVGFWSDWGYLNQIIGQALEAAPPLSVTIIDPTPSAALAQKAPQLWALAHAENVVFSHVQASGAEELDALRRAFSTNYMRQVLAQGQAAFEATEGAPCDAQWLELAAFDAESLYMMRRDAEGEPSGAPARLTRPEGAEALGYFHLLLRRANAEHTPEGYRLNGLTVRVVNGAGRVLSSMRQSFIEAPTALQADVIVAAGAVDLGAPGNIVREGQPGSVVRPGPAGLWCDLQAARSRLSV